MAVQLQITLPLDWASDFDRVAERWYFFHQPSGFCQYLLPKVGDEITRAAELVPRLPPRPVQTITTTMEAMSIVQDKQQSTVTAVVIQQMQTPAPITDSQVLQRKVSTPQQVQQVPLATGNVPQQIAPVTIPNTTSVRRTSGTVSRKPLPRQNSAPQQQPQVPVQQRQDSQISPRTSVSQASIAESTIQPAQQQLVQSPRSSLSQTSIAELPLEQTQQQAMVSPRSSLSQTSIPEHTVPQVQQRPMQSPRSSFSQTSIAESPLQQTNSQPMPMNGAPAQNQAPNPNGAMQAPQQPTNLQYAPTAVQSPEPTPIQEWTTEQVESGSKSAPTENPAVFWSEGFVESPRSLAQFQSPYSASSRPKLANRLSTSAIKMPKKAYEASKDYIKAHPGRTTAIAGGIVGGVGVVAEVCGANGLSDAVAASKIYLNVQRARERKRKSHSLPQSTAHVTTPGVAQNNAAASHANGPSAKDVAQELFKMMQQQGQIPSVNQPTAQQNNINQPLNQGATSNLQNPSQQYFPPQYPQQQFVAPQYPQPQFIPQQAPVQSNMSSANMPMFVPPLQVNQVQTTPDPSITDYQPPSSPILTGTQTPPPQSQPPTPPLSFSDPSLQPPPLFDPSTISPDTSTLQYDQFLQDQTSTTIANQAILGSQSFTTSLTGQNMFVPGDLGQSDTCSVTSIPFQVASATSDVSADWAGQGVAVDDYSSDGDDGFGYDSC